MPSAPDRRRTLGIALGVAFGVAMFMGPGPGNALITPDPGSAPATFLGVPALYAWALGWFLVQALLIAALAAFVWKDGPDGDKGEGS